MFQAVFLLFSMHCSQGTILPKEEQLNFMKPSHLKKNILNPSEVLFKILYKDMGGSVTFRRTLRNYFSILAGICINEQELLICQQPHFPILFSFCKVRLINSSLEFKCFTCLVTLFVVQWMECRQNQWSAGKQSRSIR